jgi:aspartate aminotransferase-like enzyme
MGPGPADVHPRILSAMARPTIGHLDPAFVGMMDETKEGLKAIFKTEITGGLNDFIRFINIKIKKPL